VSMLPVPEERIPIVWQNTVVDIEPTSRYGPKGTPDTATINTSMLLDVRSGGRVQFLAPGHYERDAAAGLGGEPASESPEVVESGQAAFRDLLARFAEMRRAQTEAADRLLGKVRRFHRFSLELGEGHRIVRYFARLPIIEEEDGSYRFSAVYPLEFAELAKGGDFSVVVLLPRTARGYEDAPTYDVKLTETSREPAPTVFGDGDRESLGERVAVSWYWRADPTLEVRYVYVS